jgi:hypothetical protein
MRSTATIDTIGAIGSLTHCGSSSTRCQDQACVKTSVGAWVNGAAAPWTGAWTCALSKDFEPTTLAEFVAAEATFTPSCPGACSVHCSVISNHVIVTHDTTSDHSHHRCYKEPSPSSDCTCECFSSAAELAASL